MHPIVARNPANEIFTRGPVSTEALAPTTLSFAKGDHVALVGASGSGKSTLLTLIAAAVAAALLASLVPTRAALRASVRAALRSE